MRKTKCEMQKTEKIGVRKSSSFFAFRISFFAFSHFPSSFAHYNESRPVERMPVLTFEDLHRAFTQSLGRPTLPQIAMQLRQKPGIIGIGSRLVQENRRAT